MWSNTGIAMIVLLAGVDMGPALLFDPADFLYWE